MKICSQEQCVILFTLSEIQVFVGTLVVLFLFFQFIFTWECLFMDAD